MKRLALLTLLLGTLTMAYCTLSAHELEHDSPQYGDGAFRNPVKMHETGFMGTMRILYRMAFEKPDDTAPSKTVPVHAITREQLLVAPDNSVFRLGHSTILLKLDGQFWLTDPVFSERASPFQWLGPQRFHQPPISIADLPPIKGVILSHDHYDHLDHAAVLALAAKTEHFLAPLGVGDTLVKWGVPAGKVQQLDWWQSTAVDGVRLTATPAQHFSGRSLTDRNKTLWASWVIQAGGQRIFFSGDTGYFKGFKEIGDKYGPFDLTMMETGAYDPQWPDISSRTAYRRPSPAAHAILHADDLHLHALAAGRERQARAVPVALVPVAAHHVELSRPRLQRAEAAFNIAVGSHLRGRAGGALASTKNNGK
eukprot:gene32303-39886_t